MSRLRGLCACGQPTSATSVTVCRACYRRSVAGVAPAYDRTPKPRTEPKPHMAILYPDFRKWSTVACPLCGAAMLAEARRCYRCATGRVPVLLCPTERLAVAA